jgi:amidohydrolase
MSLKFKQYLTPTFASLVVFMAALSSQQVLAADASIKLAINEHYDSHLEDLFLWFHQNPELGFQEQRTAARMAQELRDLGIEVVEGVGQTGLVGMIENGAGPLVLVRADMDGLPILEDSGLAYSSRNRQINSSGDDVPVMHACGHDMHMTTLVGTAKLLMDNRDKWSGTIMLVGQPA